MTTDDILRVARSTYAGRLSIVLVGNAARIRSAAPRVGFSEFEGSD